MTTTRIISLALKCLAVGATLRFGAFAQSPVTAPRFEVASVRASLRQSDWRARLSTTTGPRMAPSAVIVSGNHLDVEGITMKGLISRAYAIDARLIVGPSWVMDGDATFAIHAIMPSGSTKDEVPPMLKALLEERFGFASYFATVDQTAYALMTAKNGPKLGAARDLDSGGCTNWEDGLGPPGSAGICRTSRIVGDQTVVTRIYRQSTWGPSSSSVSGHEWHDEFYRIAMPKLAQYLSNQLAPEVGPGGENGPTRPIVRVFDRTGLSGDWDVVPDTIRGGDKLLPSLSASFEKQGLRLERTTAPIEQLIVDRVYKAPTEN